MKTIYVTLKTKLCVPDDFGFDPNEGTSGWKGFVHSPEGRVLSVRSQIYDTEDNQELTDLELAVLDVTNQDYERSAAEEESGITDSSHGTTGPSVPS